MRCAQKLILTALAGLAVTSGALAQSTVSLLGGKLTFIVPSNFKQDSADGALASYGAKDGDEWLNISLAKSPLREGGLKAWMERKKTSYTEGMPPEIRSHMRWMDQKIVTRDGRNWADLQFDCVPDGPDGESRAFLYTRFFATTVDGRLLEVVVSSNLTSDPKRKAALDQIVDSVKFKP